MTYPIYLFLDFDGVLCTAHTYKRWRKAGGKVLPDPFDYDPQLLELLFDPECCRNVQQLCQMTGAQVVLSTSWREGHDFEVLKELLLRVGITAPVIGKTPILPKEPRGMEIKKWLRDRETQWGRHPVEKILVLEDVEDITPYRSRQVTTTFNGARPGFRERHLKTALRVLGWEVEGNSREGWTFHPPVEFHP